MPLPKDPEKIEEWKRKQREHLDRARAKRIYRKGYKQNLTDEQRRAHSERVKNVSTEERERRKERALKFKPWEVNRGRKLTPEHLAKLHKFHRGRTYDEMYGERAGEERRKRREGNKGKQDGICNSGAKKGTAKTVEQRKGKTYAEIYGVERGKIELAKRKETRRKQALLRVPNPEPRRLKHGNDFRYADWRNAVFQRDDYKCRRCDIHSWKLRAHHIFEWADYPELRYDVENGETLCNQCHDEHHWKYMPKYKKLKAASLHV